MSSTTGRIAGGSTRRSSATALSAPVPVVSHHHHLHQLLPLQHHRPGNAWVATSPPSASAVALSHNPMGAHSFPISSGTQHMRGVSVAPLCPTSHASTSTSAPMLTSGIDLRSLAQASCRVAPASASALRRGTHPVAPHSDGHPPSRSTPSSFGSAPTSSPFLAASTASAAAAGPATRWPAPSRCRTVQMPPPAVAAAVAPLSAAPAASSSSASASAGAASAVLPRPPSPPYGLLTSRYFEGFCPEGDTECSAVWGQLRWCSTWQQMRRMYDSMLREEAAVVAATAAVVSQVAVAATAAGGVDSGSDSSSGEEGAASSVDTSAETAAAATGNGGSAPSAIAAAAATTSSASSRAVPGLLTRDETYAFLLQLQDFYHLRLDAQELDELQAFRCRLVRDLSRYVRRLNAEQLEAMCCASAVSGNCLTRERADAVQERLLKILTANSGDGAANTSVNGKGNASTNGVSGGSGGGGGEGRRRRSPAVGGFQVLTPALNIIFALYDHGYLPQVALLQAVFRQAVDHCCEVTRSQWHGLQGLARRFRFLLDDHWLDDLHIYLRDPLSCTTDYGRLASILGCISAFTVNKAMEALDTRVLMVVEAIERRYDEGRSLLSAHQLCVFTALLVDMQSPFRSKWLGAAMDYLGSCRSHLAGLSPATLVLAVELVLRGRGWDEQRLLSKLFRQLFATYAKHPTSYARRGTSNVSGCPPRAPSRIITAAAAAPAGTLPLPSPASSSPAPSLAAMAAAAAWDVDVGGAGGAASPPLDLASLVDWLASKVPPSPGPELSDTLDFLRPFVSDLVESSRSQLASQEPRRIPGLIKAVAALGYSPSREWVSEAFMLMAGGAEALSGGELVAMLRLSHAQGLPLPHSTLDAVSRQHARILPLMRAVDLQRLLDCWVADRYIPSKEQLEGFFDALCDVFGIEPSTLKAAASRSGQSLALASFDSDTSVAVESAIARTGRPQGQSASGSRPAPSSPSYLDLQVFQAAGGSMSAGAADGVTGAISTSSVLLTRSTTMTAAEAEAAGDTSGLRAGLPPRGDGAAAGSRSVSTACAATASAAAAVAADAAAAAVAAAIAAAKAKSPSLGSLDPRPKDSLLQPSEAQSMLILLEQYRQLLLEAKRSDLLIVMNLYRAAVSSALREVCQAASGPASGGGAKEPITSKLLQAALRGERPGMGRGAAATAAAAAAANARSTTGSGNGSITES